MLDLSAALKREEEWGNTMRRIKTATIAKKTKDRDGNFVEGTRIIPNLRQPASLLPIAEQVEQTYDSQWRPGDTYLAGSEPERTGSAQQARSVPANETGPRGQVNRFIGLLNRRTRGMSLPRGTARVVADAPGGASKKNKTKKNKVKKSRKERKKSQIKKR